MFSDNSGCYDRSRPSIRPSIRPRPRKKILRFAAILQRNRSAAVRISLENKQRRDRQSESEREWVCVKTEFCPSIIVVVVAVVNSEYGLSSKPFFFSFFLLSTFLFLNSDDNDENDENKSRSSQADRDAGRRELQGSNSATNTEAASTDDKSVSSKTISSKMDGKDYKNVSSKSVVSSKTEEYMPEKDIHDTTPAGATANSGFAVVEFTDVPDEELAVAVAINEEDDADKDYVYAIEYDPDAKPPFYQNRRFCFYAVGGFVVFLALAAILIVGTVVLSNKGETIVITLAPTPTPTQSPTKTKLGLYIERVSQELSTGDSSLTQTEAVELITQPDSPHIKTMDWMMNEDPMQLDETDKGFFQRYMMVFFYFSTTNSGEDEWRSCNPPTDGEPDTCTYLLSDDTTNIVPIPDRGRWLTGLDVCSWNGVLCAGGEDVLGIELCT